jgi:hypothetical protein
MRKAGALVGLVVVASCFVSPSAAADVSPPPDICLTIGLAALDDPATEAIVTAVEGALATRPVLIPEPRVMWTVATGSDEQGGSLSLPVWTDAPAAFGGPDSSATIVDACGLELGTGTWSASIAGAFLRAGTKRELAAVPTTPGFTSDIDVEWREAEDLVRTVLTFSGPLGIPSGTCWMDDVVSPDGQGGSHAETTTGSATSPFGDGVCGRFEEYLASGGAGAQALVLLPGEIALADGDVLHLRVEGVDVRADGVHLWGDVELRSS